MPIQQSVGKGGANRPDDTRHVQSLLNDWRESNQLAPIGVDGLVGPQTIGAILEFQQRVTHIVDGRVDPGGPALTQLEALHDSRQLAALSRDVLEILDYFERLRLMSGNLVPGLSFDLQLKANAVRDAALDLQRLHGGGAAPLASRLPQGPNLLAIVQAPAAGAAAGGLTLAQMALLAALMALVAFAVYAIVNPKGAQALREKVIEWAAATVVEIIAKISAITALVNRCREKIGAKATTDPACRDALAEFENKVALTQAKQAELQLQVRQAIDSPISADIPRIRTLMQEVNVLNADMIAAGNKAMLICGCLGPVPVS
jgi:peptidoglycan hydrolase-like protein with peptidoglycan-binding domain